MKKVNIIAILNSVSGDYSKEKILSGGDRILIESLKVWKDWDDKINYLGLLTCNSGKLMVEEYIANTENIDIKLVSTPGWVYRNLLFLYVYKTIKAIFLINKFPKHEKTIIFASSDFFPDVLPAIFEKISDRKKVNFSTAFYFFASAPFSKDFPYKGFIPKLRGILYYYSQRIIYFFIRKLADKVVACNEIDRQIFIKDKYPFADVSAIYGGVDLNIPRSVPEPQGKRFDAVFMARFHPQKGPMEAVKTWNEIIKSGKKLKLAMIGNGTEENAVRKYIRNNSLEEYITLLGFLDGKEKYEILKSSKIFLHTAIYETGGMAAAEGMAAGLPVIAFDHSGFDYIYPKGIVRVSPIGNCKKMVGKIIDLLENDNEYARLKEEALELVKEWDWKNRASLLYNNIIPSSET